jgi:hypothetical protein
MLALGKRLARPQFDDFRYQRPSDSRCGSLASRPARTWALISGYSRGNSLPSRLSHSSSDGVKGRGAAEVPCLGLGEEIDAETEVFPPLGVEGFAMLLSKSLKR